MALINPTTGSSKFKAVVRHEAIVSLAGDEPSILEQAEEFGIKLLADATNDEEISFKDLQEVPNEEIGEDGFWIHSKAAKLKTMSQEELIAMVLELQAKTGETPTPKQAPVEEDVPAEEEAEDTADEPAEESEEEEAPAPKKRKKKRPAAAPKKEESEEGSDDEEETEEVAF